LVAKVARRYVMNTNMIHKWLRDPRFMPECVSDAMGAAEDVKFATELRQRGLDKIRGGAEIIQEQKGFVALGDVKGRSISRFLNG